MKQFLITACLLFCIGTLSVAQESKSVSTEDYQNAVNQLAGYTTQRVENSVQLQWLDDNRFWYMKQTPAGDEYTLVNPVDGKAITAKSRNELFEKGNIVPGPTTRSSRLEILSPDGKTAVFIRNWNLWMKDIASGTEKALTTDGVTDFGYATDNAGWKHSDRPIVTWSPDSKKIATFQQDQRHIKDMHLVKTTVGAPELMSWKYPLPSDDSIIKIHRLIIDITAEPKVVRLKMKSDDRRGTLCDDISCEGGFDDLVWSSDSKHMVFVSTPRDHKEAKVRRADAMTGEVTDIFEEKVATQYESGQGAINWKYFSDTDEIIWYSERSDWGHLYLYDAKTGKMKNQITSGDFVVREIIRVDPRKREIYFIGSGKEGGNPYYKYVYKVNFDGSNFKLLTPEQADHNVVLSSNGMYFSDSYSTPDTPPTYIVRDNMGKLIKEIGSADITKLKESGWKAPETFVVRSADDRWDLYGLMYTPAKMEAGKQYPIIVNIYPGPQGGSVGSWSFRPSRGDCQALTELGFVVIQLEGSCNPNRSKSFHDACYGNMGENTLSDHVSALEQLKKKHSFMDLDKIGIWGHSGGGFATAAAMFKYPDFFKVGISESGNHDNRNYEDDWGERYIGLEAKGPDGSTNYEAQANQTHAKNLKGKLMLIHGGMDDNVPPYNSYLVADELIKANKDFDFITLPNARHGFGSDGNYIMRRRWDYFVKHLLNQEPPKEFVIKFDARPAGRP